MKIVSYNINGINAFAKNGKLEQLLTDIPADVYCFQEVKADETKCSKIFENIPELFNNYTMVNFPSNGKKGYAGVSTLIHNNVADRYIGSYTEEILFEDKTIDENYKCTTTYDNTYTSGRILVSEFDTFILVNVYVVNSGNKEKIRRHFDYELERVLRELWKPFIVCGDFNVCATEQDYWGKYDKSINSGPGLMDFEIYGMKRLCDNMNLVDVYRYMHPYERKYTWFSPMNKSSVTKRQGWRIDYFLMSNDDRADMNGMYKWPSRVKQCDIYEGYQGADHSPIMIEL